MNLILGDCLEAMRQMPNESVDCVITDPPYGINYASNFGSEKYKQRIQTAQKWDTPDFEFTQYWREIWRVMKPNTHAYVFGTFKNYELMSKLDGFKQVLVWDKGENGNCGLGNITGWGITYELIFFYQKGKRAVNCRLPPVIRCESLASFSHGNPIDVFKHPTQKPVEIIDPLIKVSSNANETILDPFMGSGTTGVAALKLQRDFIGIEIDETYFKIAEKRIIDWQKQARL